MPVRVPTTTQCTIIKESRQSAPSRLNRPYAEVPIPHAVTVAVTVTNTVDAAVPAAVAVAVAVDLTLVEETADEEVEEATDEDADADEATDDETDADEDADADAVLLPDETALPVTSARSFVKSGVPKPVTGSQPVSAGKPSVPQPGFEPVVTSLSALAADE